MCPATENRSKTFTKQGGFMRYLLIALVRGYQFFISPYFPTSCRYYPTCSNYAVDAVKTHGAVKGFALAVWRILRCNPWSAGGEDPVPGTTAHHCCNSPGSSGKTSLSSGNTTTSLSDDASKRRPDHPAIPPLSHDILNR